MSAENFGLQEASKIGGRERVQTSCGLVEEEYAGLVEKSAEQAETLDGAARQGADLAVKGFDDFELFGERGDAGLEDRVGEVIEAGKETKIFAGRKARVEAKVGPRVVAKMAAHGGGMA